ncbi:hypothetical protein FN846DRAFT_885759 [Sphaerosporella brunnea]|uniref:Uncharacterized protein n=1 Tax=Sphaerosporella brunnea TaxID=1250544 RepID=A0A5J5FAY3_9PEZI|nr:hypothetical protein FN846DRAFT_885759 [Sphaerosporella brunnea]
MYPNNRLHGLRMNGDFVEYQLFHNRDSPLLVALEHYFLNDEEWLSKWGNYTTWSAVLVGRLLASKAITTNEWFKTLVELGGKLGVETPDIGLPALYSLHLLLKKKVDEKLGAQVKRSKVAAKKLAAERVLAAANTCVDAADQEMAAAEIRTEGVTLEVAAGQTRADSADQEGLVVEIRAQGGRLGADAGRVHNDAAQREDEAAKLNIETAGLNMDPAKLDFARQKFLFEQSVAGRSGSGSHSVASSAASTSAGVSPAEGAAAPADHSAIPATRPDTSGVSTRTGWVPPLTGSGNGSRSGQPTVSRARFMCGVPAPCRSTTQARGTSGSGTKVAGD